MRRLALCALLAASGCSESLDLPWQAEPSIPLPRNPSLTPTPTPVPTPFVPGVLPDDTGDGHSGMLFHPSGDLVVNACSPLATASGTVVTLPAPPPAEVEAGDRVVVWQVQDTFAMQGDTAPVTLPGGAGLFELARIENVAGSTYTLTTALANGYVSTGTTKRAQVCTIPEYTNANVGTMATISAAPWDGESGGLVALFVQTLTLNGTLSADGAGFRGGSTSSGGAGGDSNVELETGFASGAGKAEGLDPSGLGRYGRGNFANGAGGGNSRNAGGGGGGNRGAGGIGGRQSIEYGIVDDTRGLPGAAVLASDLRFVLGGGGGGGHQNNGSAPVGGRGGGLVLIFAEDISGEGSISAAGAPGIGGTDGGGGGGAGGTIVVLLAIPLFGPASFQGGVLPGELFTGPIIARGGDGGSLEDVDDTSGPGGGGGGGWFASNAQTLVDNAVTLGGTRGLNPDADPNGAENGANGVAELFQ